jgi:RimJ/RimL family protein N-acetyltransferase
MLPELHTDRLVLREMCLADEAELQAYRARPEHIRYQAVEPDKAGDAAPRVRHYLQHRGSGASRRLYVYIARERSRNALIGEIGLSCFAHPALGVLGFGVAADHWGKGYATEMAARLIAFGFGALDMHRISADVAVENTACRRVLEKIGMVHEGTARDCIWARGWFWTEARYAILMSDYEGLLYSADITAHELCC